MFADLEDAPVDTTPEKKKQKVSYNITGHFGPKNLPLEEGQVPVAQLHIKGLPYTAQQQLKELQVKTFDLNGQEFLDAFKYSDYNTNSKFKGVLYKKDCGQKGTTLELCKGPGAMCVPTLNEHYAKLSFDDISERIFPGSDFKWQVSGYENPRNVIQIQILDGREMAVYGPARFQIQDALCGEFDKLDKMQARALHAPPPPHRDAEQFPCVQYR